MASNMATNMTRFVGASLVNGANTSDAVNVGSGATLDNRDPFTVLMWINPSTITNNRVLWAKDTTSSLQKVLVFVTGGFLQLIILRASVASSFVSSNNALPTNQWRFIAVTYNSANGAGEAGNIYVGSLATPAVECTYSTATNGSGLLTTDATGDMRWGNGFVGNATIVSAMQGRMAYGAFFGVELGLADIRDYQFTPRAHLRQGISALDCHEFGVGGTGPQLDFSGNGNTGTVTGAVKGLGLPLIVPPLYRPGMNDRAMRVG